MKNDAIQLDDVPQAIADGRIAREFTGEPAYDPASDSIFAFREEAAFKAVRVDGFLTVFRSRRTNQVVGVQLKNVSQVAAAFSRRTGRDLPHDAKLELITDEVIRAEYLDWDAQVAPQIYYTLRSGDLLVTYIPAGLRSRLHPGSAPAPG